jgi:hypothetical protein
MKFGIVNEKEMQLLKEAKEKLTKDLKEKPYYVLTDSDLMCYNHNKEKDPIISEIMIRYNGKEYIFHISHIDIKEVKDAKDS